MQQQSQRPVILILKFNRLVCDKLQNREKVFPSMVLHHLSGLAQNAFVLIPLNCDNCLPIPKCVAIVIWLWFYESCDLIVMIILISYPSWGKKVVQLFTSTDKTSWVIIPKTIPFSTWVNTKNFCLVVNCLCTAYKVDSEIQKWVEEGLRWSMWWRTCNYL